jgi:nitrogen fixation protein NifU and related proteins
MDDYSREIVDNYLHPRRKGKLVRPTVSARLSNPSCGDVVEIGLIIEKGRIKEARFSGTGCAISTAASSMLMGLIEGKTEKQVLSMGEKDVKGMLGIDISPAREHCALLPLQAVQKAILGRDGRRAGKARKKGANQR